MALCAALAVSNEGKIRDCYAIWNKSDKSKKVMVSSNEGSLVTSALLARGSCLEICDSEGRISNDYNIHKTSDLKKLGFDVNKSFEYAGEDNLVRFQGGNWHLRINKTGGLVIHISTVNEYIEFASKVNSQDKRYIEAMVYLDNDLDFKGRNIPIVGINRECAFRGIFDGRNHIIWNGFIKDENAVYTALFGYMKGTVANLIFDGRVQSDKNLAGICGVNMGRISSCGSVVRLKGKDERYNAGGIVVSNEGTLDMSYVLLQKQVIIPPFVYILLIALIAIIIGILGYFSIVSALNSGKDYAKIEVDPGQIKNDNDDGNKNGNNSLSFTLYRGVEISRASRACAIDFDNPSSNANKIVVSLYVTDSSGQRVLVGSSKAVSPGYGIKSLPITNLEALSGNERDGLIVLESYNEVTENKTIVNMELPVTITYIN